MNLKFKHVWYGGGRYRQVERLYRQAFPPVEQLPLWLLCLTALRPGIDFYAVYDGDRFCGLLYLSGDRRHTLIFYFAVGADLRDKGYGAEILKWIQNKSRCVSVIMESLHESCDNAEQRLRRKGFYLRNGFHDTGYYMQGRDGIFDVLCTDPMVGPAEYGKLIRRIMFWGRKDIIGKF